MQKSNWWKIIRETNFYLTPKNLKYMTRTIQINVLTNSSVYASIQLLIAKKKTREIVYVAKQYVHAKQVLRVTQGRANMLQNVRTTKGFVNVMIMIVLPPLDCCVRAVNVNTLLIVSIN